jgi:hypothetical protein
MEAGLCMPDPSPLLRDIPDEIKPWAAIGIPKRLIGLRITFDRWRV